MSASGTEYSNSILLITFCEQPIARANEVCVIFLEVLKSLIRILIVLSLPKIYDLSLLKIGTGNTLYRKINILYRVKRKILHI